MYKFLCHIVAILVPARLVMINRNWQRKAEVGITPILSSDISWSNQIMHRSTSNRYRINVLYFSNLGKYNCYIALNKYINVLYRIPDRTFQTSQYPVCDPKTFFLVLDCRQDILQWPDYPPTQITPSESRCQTTLTIMHTLL